MKKSNRRAFLKTTGIAAIGVSCLTGGLKRLHAEQTANPAYANKAKEFRPGERVRISGIYAVLHDKLDGDDHAQTHQVMVIGGNTFPRCKGCGEWVKFRLLQEAEYIDRDPHFKS
jgi:hypothetical protein